MGFTISRFILIVMFILMMLFFFFWASNQIADLGLFFGFRNSHTVANDVSNLMTSLSGIPGTGNAVYEITPGDSSTIFNYEIEISDGLVCAKSFVSEIVDIGGEVETFDDSSRFVADCASHPFDLDNNIECKTDAGGLEFTISKIETEDGFTIQIDGEGCGSG